MVIRGILFIWRQCRQYKELVQILF
jgi:hypothetical protein